MKITKMDWDIIESHVEEETRRYSYDKKSTGLLSLSLQQLFPAIHDELLECITDGPDDRGIDAIHIVDGEDIAEIYIFQSKHRESLSTVQKTINETEILKISSFLDELFNKSSTFKKCNNLRLMEAVKRIWQLHEQGTICQYKIICCTNGGGFSESAQRISDAVCANHPHVQFEVYGPEDLISAISTQGKIKESGSLQVISKEILERSDGDVRGIIASVDARSFIDLIKTKDNKHIKRHIFDDNLRIFLGKNGGYNHDIINTATSSDSYLFWYLNNGITITCKDHAYNKGHSNPIIRMEDFQIVNGAQTSHSLFEAYKINPESLSNVTLMVRIYATDRTDIAERVAVATNSQARIQSRDLRSNDKTLKKIEILFKQKGYYFERKKNMHSDKPDEKRIDALKLGQIIFSFYLREPDRAKTDSDSIFGSRFHNIFSDTYKIEDLCKVFELYRIIEKMRDDYSNKNSKGPHQYLVYGHWFILFACKVILDNGSSQEIPTGKDAEDLIEKAISLVSTAVGPRKSVAHYQMFRSSQTKEKILGEFRYKQTDLFDLINQNLSH
ncbi:AIPR family protein [Thalassospiraceae bacterium SW-3-3]|nr:AIPR family protein [Thalassospiraceae bacterium SW-3-3]